MAAWVLGGVVLLGLTACGSKPVQAPVGGTAGTGSSTRPANPPPLIDSSRDGPEANPPPDLHKVPDAVPQIEPVRSGGPNKPYEVGGQVYTPLLGDPPLVERGLASWYGRKFHGRSTSNGETYNMYAMTAAHKTMPLPSYARVRNPTNGREVVVRVNDRGPFHSDRIIDLSYTAALKLGLLGGVATVEVERLTYEAIRTGSWRSTPGGVAGTPPAPVAAAAAAPVAAALPLPGVAPVPAAGPSASPDAIGDLLRRVGDQKATEAAAGNADAATPPTAPLPRETGAPAQAAIKAAPGFWLQLGAFGRREGAVGFQERVATQAPWLAPLMTIFNERQLHRLQAGPYASRADAAAAGERLREALQLVPAIVERR